MSSGQSHTTISHILFPSSGYPILFASKFRLKSGFPALHNLHGSQTLCSYFCHFTHLHPIPHEPLSSSLVSRRVERLLPPNCPLTIHLVVPCLPTDLALETCQKSLHSQKMLPLQSQRRFVLLYNGETTDLWPRLGSSRPPIRLPYANSNHARSTYEISSSSLTSTRVTIADRPAARKSMSSRTAPICTSRKSRLSDSGGVSTEESEASVCSGLPEGSRDAAREPSLGPTEEEREEEQRSTSHRGS